LALASASSIEDDVDDDDNDDDDDDCPLVISRSTSFGDPYPRKHHALPHSVRHL
jgi:hypothetical protein